MTKTPEEILEENGFDIEILGQDGTILFRNPDYADSICGITYNNEIVYDFERMVEHLISNSIAENYDEAVDFILYNASFGISGCEKMPIIMYPIEQRIQ